MHSYVQTKSARHASGSKGAAEHRTDAHVGAPASVSGRAGAGLLNRSPRVQSLLQMREALDEGARVQSQLALQRALNPGGAEPAQAGTAEASVRPSFAPVHRSRSCLYRSSRALG